MWCVLVLVCITWLCLSIFIISGVMVGVWNGGCM